MHGRTEERTQVSFSRRQRSEVEARRRQHPEVLFRSGSSPRTDDEDNPSARLVHQVREASNRGQALRLVTEAGLETRQRETDLSTGHEPGRVHVSVLGPRRTSEHQEQLQERVCERVACEEVLDVRGVDLKPGESQAAQANRGRRGSVRPRTV